MLVYLPDRGRVAGALGRTDHRRAPLRLIDQHGQTLTQTDLKGEPYLGLLRSPFTQRSCPTTLLELSNVLDKLGPEAEKVRVLFITVDARTRSAGGPQELSEFQYAGNRSHR